MEENLINFMNEIKSEAPEIKVVDNSKYKTQYEFILHKNPRRDPKGSSIQVIRAGPRAVDIKREQRAERKRLKLEKVENSK